MSDPLSGKSGSSRRSTWWGKIAASIVLDPEVRDSDVRVFCVLALGVKRASPIVSIGTRLIAEQLGWGHAKVVRCLKRLVDAGYLCREDGKRGKRAVYELTPWVYKNPVRVAGRLTITPASGVTVQVEGEMLDGAGSVRSRPVKRREATA